MRRLILPILLLLAPAGALFAQGGPTAVPVEPIKDFEIVARGEKIVHTFEIKNEGSNMLEINSVRPACGCTVAEFDKNIAPGKVGRILATVDTSDFFGPISKSIAVFTNDTENPKLQLVVKANVKPYIGATPGYVRYIYVQGEPIKPISQTLWAEDGADFNIVKVTKPYSYLETSFHEASEDERAEEGKGKQWRVNIELKKDAPVGALRKYVEIVTDHPKQKKVKIPVSGFVRPRQHITPTEADFGSLQGDSLPLRRSFHFTNFATQTIELNKVESGIQGITAKVEAVPSREGHRFKVIVTIGPEVPKGEFDTVLKIHTSDSLSPIVKLPLKGTVL